MEYSINDQGGTRTVSMSGRFTFSDNPRLREIVNGLSDSGQKQCVLDLSQLEFIDSAGLGMLLLVRDTANKQGMKVVLRKPRDQVKRMLDVARFGEILPIEE